MMITERRGYNSISHCNLVHKFVPTPQAMKISDAQAAVDKEWKKLEKRFQTGSWTKIGAKRRSFWKLKATKRKSTLLLWWTSVITKKLSENPNTRKNNGRVVFRGDIVKDDSDPYAELHWTRFVCVSNDSSENSGCYSKTTRLCRTYGRPSVRLHPTMNGRMFPKLLKFPKSQCPDVWIHFSLHKRPKSLSNIKDLVVLLERTLQGHPLAVLLWGQTVRGSSVGTWMGKVPNWECLCVDRKEGLHIVTASFRTRSAVDHCFLATHYAGDVDANDNGLNGRCRRSGFVHWNISFWKANFRLCLCGKQNWVGIRNDEGQQILCVERDDESASFSLRWMECCVCVSCDGCYRITKVFVTSRGGVLILLPCGSIQ